MMKKETAEQQLLKMIETSASGGGTSVKAQQKAVHKQSVVSVVKTINNVLFVGLLVAVGFLFNEIRSGMQYLARSIPLTSDNKLVNLKMDAIVPSPQRLSFYLANLSRRNFFQPYEQETNAVAAASPDKNNQIVQRASHFRLVGVSWLSSVDSASVMIEDTEKKITYFLKKGEKIGDIFVKTIYADSAVLGYDNEEMTITYDKSQM